MAGRRPTPTPRSGKDLLKALQALGWRIAPAGSGHWKAYAPGGSGIVTVSATASDGRAIKNAVADARRAGAVL